MNEEENLLDEGKVIRDGRAFGVNEVKADIYHIDKDYDLECHPGKKITKTGLLKVATLESRKKLLPKFIFRWDEKTDILKVYILNVPSVDEKNFNKGINGYAGHHSKRVSKNKVFKVFIKTPDRIIFNGLITSPLHREQELSTGIGLKSSTKGVWLDKNGNVKRVDLG